MQTLQDCFDLAGTEEKCKIKNNPTGLKQVLWSWDGELKARATKAWFKIEMHDISNNNIHCNFNVLTSYK